jgi:hypothetical protein
MNKTLLTDEQKSRICGVLSVGCDRETAVDFIGCTSRDLHRTMQHDPEFAVQVRRTEAANEVTHMRSLHEVAKDPKNWRISVWWLEMRSPERFKPRNGKSVTLPQLDEFLNVLAEIIGDEVESEDDQTRVLDRMMESLRELKDRVQDAAIFPQPQMLPFDAAHASADFDDQSADGQQPSGDDASE